MQIYTLNVGQGQFVVVAGSREAFIVDTYLPLTSGQETEFLKRALSKILKNKKLTGLMITGFDSDHFNEIGMKIVLNKYRPHWIMYPKYFKQTDTANSCFRVIRKYQSANTLAVHSMALPPARAMDFDTGEFQFQIFAPCDPGSGSSNNSSLVCKVIEKKSQKSYLITGDTEADKWDVLVRWFGRHLESDILAAPHHGSSNGITAAALKCIRPQKILISAGLNNSYGHPHPDTMLLFQSYGSHVYATNQGDGISLHTSISDSGLKTKRFKLD